MSDGVEWAWKCADDSNNWNTLNRTDNFAKAYILHAKKRKKKFALYGNLSVDCPRNKCAAHIYGKMKKNRQYIIIEAQIKIDDDADDSDELQHSNAYYYHTSISTARENWLIRLFGVGRAGERSFVWSFTHVVESKTKIEINCMIRCTWIGFKINVIELKTECVERVNARVASNVSER